MRKSTLLLSIAALAGVSASAALWIELRAERDLNDELSARLQSVSVAPMAPATAVEPPLPAVPRVEALTPQTRAAPTPASKDPAGNMPVRGGRVTGEEWMARQRQLMTDPVYREAWREQQRLQMSGRRERLKDGLGLSDEQADAVIDASIDRQMSWQLQSNALTEEGMRAQRDRMEAARLAEQAKLREVLGHAKYQKYEDYVATSASRQQVDRLRNELSGADSLRDDQVEPLIAAIHAEQSQMTKEMQAYRDSLGSDQPSSMEKMAERQTEQLKAANARIRNAAGAILSPSQLEQLDAMLKREVARHEAQMRMQRIQLKLETPPDAAGNAN